MIEVGSESVNWDAVYGALASETRRSLLRYLTDEQGAATLAEMAAFLVDEGVVDVVGDVDPERALELAEIKTYHAHVPKLVDAGLLTWDEEDRTVQLEQLAYHLPVVLVTPTVMNHASAAAVADQQADKASD